MSDVSNLVILNPRRNDWDASWEQRADDPRFFEQVSWELDMLDAADIVVMYLAPGTKSPVSLLELGLCARSGKLKVCCPQGFWRRGNVEVVCTRNQIPLFETLDDLIADLKAENRTYRLMTNSPDAHPVEVVEDKSPLERKVPKTGTFSSLAF